MEILNAGGLYTQETFVFREGIEAVDLNEPRTIFIDQAGHAVVSDGNHHAYMAYLAGKPFIAEPIGRILKDVSQDPYFRKVSELKVR